MANTQNYADAASRKCLKNNLSEKQSKRKTKQM